MFKSKVESQKSKVRMLLVKFIAVSFVILAPCLFSPKANAQCAMCRAALETEGNKSKGEAVNDGIVYLMLIPYVLVGGIGYAVYRMNKKKK
ncbi:hypothetical protein FNO01nite_02730 [Flavobacterium noncentrifugens]|uniref:Uncharacterized protein n=1 Tax=Flavobacterium noncentrifugens TaxID=1128970 RepID=A0A1G8RVS9_9FLAO|nr:hypothetical protein [Flavobacterium noncentrifugens]GEP49601.1 hypothetical protein FNO01nite_02730 [Flavobacterium noncentrifugens]SDJ21062.1 hypothetical protein SAMN04487935_0304 [Flavobacterium noncentrifugens]